MIIIRNGSKCGGECGEKAILSTKDGHSLPLRHFFLLKKVADAGAPGSGAAILSEPGDRTDEINTRHTHKNRG